MKSVIRLGTGIVEKKLSESVCIVIVRGVVAELI
jgi:hypothetical protein